MLVRSKRALGRTARSHSQSKHPRHARRKSLSLRTTTSDPMDRDQLLHRPGGSRADVPRRRSQVDGRYRSGRRRSSGRGVRGACSGALAGSSSKRPMAAVRAAPGRSQGNARIRGAPAPLGNDSDLEPVTEARMAAALETRATTKGGVDLPLASVALLATSTTPTAAVGRWSDRKAPAPLQPAQGKTLADVVRRPVLLAKQVLGDRSTVSRFEVGVEEVDDPLPGIPG